MKGTSVLKKEQVLLEETGVRRLLTVLYWWPEVEFSLTELAEKAGVSKSTASRLIDTLVDPGIATADEERIVFRIKANTNSFQFIKRKIAYNLHYVYESGLVEFLEDALGHPPAIVLFGSFREGEDISTSDVDIAVETLEDMDISTIRPEGIERIERHYAGRNIQVHVFNRKRIDINVFNNIANGIVLSGFLEVKP
jgi:predicted nucleotidyltransferase